MDIVDSQLHLAHGMIRPTLEAMDALGITSVLIDEFWGTWASDDPTHIAPGFRLPNGAWRASSPTAEEASLLHPDRFSYLVRVDRRDPGLQCVMHMVGAAPHARAVRVQPAWTVEEASLFAAGAYEPVFELAQEHNLPVFVFAPGHVEHLSQYLAGFPGVTSVVDHCGMGFPGIPRDQREDLAQGALGPGYFDQVLELARFPNAALKWSHAQDLFGVHDFPYHRLRPFLRRAIDAFGADRLLWASDKSVIRGHTWSDLLHCIRDDPELSTEEKEWILGRSSRKILDWPAQRPSTR